METIKKFYLNKNIIGFKYKKIIKKIAKYVYAINKVKIYGRVACLGRNVFDMRYSTENKVILVNQQKVRVDLFNAWLSGETRPKAEVIEKYMLRKDVFPLIEQQAAPEWREKNDFNYFLMDSFSELTDQKFTHKTERWSFCCHYTDINHDSDFADFFECHGLLPIEDIELQYYLFFDWFEKKFPGKKLYYIHFPTKFDSRNIFKERSKEILRIMKKYQEDRDYIKNIFIGEESVFLKENDVFPYHFSEKTNQSFLNKLCELS
jgi:hypothetical protein